MVLHSPTVGEFVHEFVTHSIALEGALWRTLKALVVEPGRLTLDYFAGRRQRYIPPLRLYLTFSLILFALTSCEGGSLRIGDVIQVRDASDAASGPVVIGFKFDDKKSTGFAPLDAAFAHIDAMPAAERAARINAGVRQMLPYVLILLVPMLAAYLRVLYWRRHRLYGEHLVVAFHAQTVAFLFACLLALVPKGPSSDWVGGTLLVVLLVHGFVALKRVYGGRVIPTIVRESILLLCYAMTVGVAVTVLTIVALSQ